MGISFGPRVTANGLVFSLDPRNPKTYGAIPGSTDHGISDWYCSENITIEYSAIYPGTQIIEIDEYGNETVKVTTSLTQPQRGTFSGIANRRYYGTKAVNLVSGQEDKQYAIIPVSFSGTNFAGYKAGSDRGSYIIYEVRAVKDQTVVNFYDSNVANGSLGTPTSTVTINKGFTTTFTSTFHNDWQFIKSDKPIIVSQRTDTADRAIASPASQYVYSRYLGGIRSNDTAPSTGGNYTTYSTDPTLPVSVMFMGDGSGFDGQQGIGYEYLSDTYSWGNVLSDYTVITPYANTVVNVYYWANNRWNLGESHSLNGTQTNAAGATRDGTLGFGVDAATLSGLANNLANGANLWKFEGTNPFALILNDYYDDEERQFGWMKNNFTRTSSNFTQSFANVADRGDRSRASIYGTPFNVLSTSEYFTFDGIDDAIIVPHKSWQNSASLSISCWVYPTTIYDRIYTIFGKGFDSGYRLKIETDGNLTFSDRGTTNVLTTTTQPMSIVQWKNIVVTASPTGSKIYVNGVLQASNTTAFGGNTSTSPLAIGAEDHLLSGQLGLEGRFEGRMSGFRFYNRVLTEAEIQRMYLSISTAFVSEFNLPQNTEALLADGEDDLLLTSEEDEVLLLQ